ncbi:S8 family serine peptidase [Cohnella luojiensis]|uniref:Peptidase S8/S53 domain-containing protein n=1 Tax=Cohnella luojiensis TaxID=652876 RepID=A0A4Y8M2E2_9BACL|nr:S8 family serine peptidase [Cohnella luojiensis]TFE28981.1 hypothetical protein E2980_06195 [Cohnella luojiensis]
MLRFWYIQVIISISILCSELLLPEVRISPEVKTSKYQTAESAPSSSLAAPVNSSAPAFLKAIGIPEAWSMINRDVTATIAIVDTGVDYNNPELKPYLLEGKNLINARMTAQDDNGHGTAVAGIMVAIAKAGNSSSGLGRWKGRFLPVKALDEFGSGNEEKLTQGIRYAVEQGANIIVLSLGLRRDAVGLRGAVEYAESNGVLLVAASGNDAAVFGDKAAVQYPAAYPTVLAVAGSEGVKPISQSTSGPENDVSAAWRVNTMAVGGGSIEMEGTSMGAPQVAATAAMIMAVHPEWKPARIRETLRRTAITNETMGWSMGMGYGFLSASKAIQADSTIDWREPNDTSSSARVFPLGKEVAGNWASLSDNDWFAFDAPYDGVYSISGNAARLFLYGEEGLIQPRSANLLPAGTIKQWVLKKGQYSMLALRPLNTTPVADNYRFVSEFTLSPDAREPNDSAASAFTLPARSQRWFGTFHKRGDVDWMVMTLPKPGIVRFSVSADTTRIDPELWVQPAGGTAIIVDDRGDGGNEQWILNNARAGKYYFRISNAVSSNPEAVIGTYAASLEYITQKEDFYEPNESPLTATPLSPDKVYNGLIHANKDQDWYRFTISKKQLVKLSVGHIPSSMTIRFELRDRKLQTLQKWNNEDGRKTLLGEKLLWPGTYYVKITADRANRNQYYGLRLQLTMK